MPNPSKAFLSIFADTALKVVHLAMLADAVDAVSRAGSNGNVDDAVLTEAILAPSGTIAKLIFRTLTLRALKIFRGFLFLTAQRGQGIVGGGVSAFAVAELSACAAEFPSPYRQRFDPGQS